MIMKKRSTFIALIPPIFFDCVVAITIITGTPNGKPEYQGVGTGFLYGHFLEKTTEAEPKERFAIYLVTNKHVLEEVKGKQVFARLNPEGREQARNFRLEVWKPDGTLAWHVHPCADVDVAVIPINVAQLMKEGIRVEYFRSNRDLLNLTKAAEVGLSEGDGVFVLGYPMGEIGGDRNYVIARNGSIARIRDAFLGSRKTFLADAFVFPGNSGGPVVVKPEVVTIDGTKAINQAYLIGMVKSYLPYTDVAFSMQTKTPRIVFYENSGLAEIIPMDYITAIIEDHRKPASDRITTCVQ